MMENAIVEQKNIRDFQRNQLYFSDGKKGEFGVNISTEISVLIKEAAKCEHYSSDVIYGIEAVNNMIETGIPGIEFFGFRDMGVDHESFINCRLNDGITYGNMHKNYRKIIAIEVRQNNEYFRDGIEVVTSEVVF